MANIGKLRIRYLNFICDKIAIVKLSHPEDLISATLEKVRIANFSQCVNLVNFYSAGNVYQPKDIEHLTHLRRFCSVGDEYFNTRNHIVEHLLEKNKLEYINIHDYRQKIITSPIRLAENIDNLRFVSTTGTTRADLVVDLSKKHKLQVYNAYFTIDNELYSGDFRGSVEVIN